MQDSHQVRLNRMRLAMERERLDALVLRLPESVLLLSGWWPMIGASTLLFPREGDATLLVPKPALRRGKLGGGECGAA